MNPYAYSDQEPLSVDPALAFFGVHNLATRGIRLAAAILDALILLALVGPGYLLALSGSQDALALGLVLMVGGGMGVTAYQWYLLSTTGQSMGKRALGIKVVREDGSPLTFVHAVILRGWIIGAIGLIPYLGTAASLVNVLFIFGADRRCIHDHIAGTRVVVVRG